jgi:hypothetical protein
VDGTAGRNANLDCPVERQSAEQSGAANDSRSRVLVESLPCELSDGREQHVYLIPITIESGPISGSALVALNPISVIQPWQSLPL